MSGIDVMSMCLRNLIKRKLRTFLTLLGVMIGTGSIILMISLGLATDAQFAQMIEDMNIDLTEIVVWPQWGGMSWTMDGDMQVMEQQDLTDESIARITALPNVLVATPRIEMELLFRSGRYAMPMWVTGVNIAALEAMGYRTAYGRLLQEGDGFAAVFGASAERRFIPTGIEGDWMALQRRFQQCITGEEVETLVDIHNDPIRLYYDTSSFWNAFWGGARGGMDDDDFGVDMEEAFRVVRSFELNVVGVLERETDMWNMWNNGVVYMDIAILQQLEQMRDEARAREEEDREFNPVFRTSDGSGAATYSQLFVLADSADNTHTVAEQIQNMGYQVDFHGRWIEQQRQSQQAIQTLLAAIAAVSLFVAAINIANTMITSVTERTREIGIMKVIGASLGDVRKLFLTEAAVIGLLGGLLGIGLALAGSYALNNFEIEFLSNLNMGSPITTEGNEGAVLSLITPWLMGLALAVASGVGLVSGFYPAWHATRLSALAAIRND